MLVLAAAFLAIIALLVTRLGSEFLPHLEEGNLWISGVDAADDRDGGGEPATRQMREILPTHLEVLTVVSQHGRPDNGSDASPFSRC